MSGIVSSGLTIIVSMIPTFIQCCSPSVFESALEDSITDVGPRLGAGEKNKWAVKNKETFLDVSRISK